MKEQASAPSYKRHRFPPAIIGHAVWLYFRFALSYRDVEELLAERGVLISYETIRQGSLASCGAVIPSPFVGGWMVEGTMGESERLCPGCGSVATRKDGHDRGGQQRFRCRAC